MKTIPGLLKRACLLGFVVAFVLPSTTFAQEKSSLINAERISMIVDTLALRLSLADSQKVRVKKIISEASAENKKAVESYKNDREILTLMRNNIKDRMDLEIKELMTSEQKKKYEEIKIDMFKANRERSEGRKRKKKEAKEDKTEN